MNSTCFCYWLKGFFEIYNPVLISGKEIEIINDHLRIITKDDELDMPKGDFLSPNDFVIWLEGFVEGKKEITFAGTKRISDKLNSVFNKVTPDRAREVIKENKKFFDKTLQKANEEITKIQKNSPEISYCSERRIC